MAVDAFSLKATIELDKGNFETGMAEAAGSVQNLSDTIDTGVSNTSTFGQVMSGVGQGLKDALTFAAVTATITETTRALWDLSNEAAHVADGIDKTSQRIGISAESYQEWTHILGQSGASMSDMDTAMRKLRSGLASGDKKMGAAFEELGLSVDDLKKKKPEDIFEDVVEAFQNMEDGLDKNTLADTIFGRGAGGLMALLNSDTGTVDALRKEAHDLGLILSDDAVKQGASFNDDMSSMESAIDKFKANVGLKAQGFFDPLVKAATDMVAGVNKALFGEDTSLEANLSKINKQYADTVKSINETSVEATGLVNLLDKIAAGDVEGEKEGGSLWNATLEALKTNIPAVAEIVDKETGKIQGGTQAIKDYIAAWKAASYEAAKDKALKSRQEALIQAQTDLANAQVEYQIQKARLDNYNSIIDNSGLNSAELEMAKYDPTTRNMYYGTDLYYALENYQDAEQAVRKQAQIVSENETALKKAQNNMDLVSQAIDAMNTEAGEATTAVEGVSTALDELDGKSVDTYINVHTNDGDVDGSHASGLNYVPFDGYRAELHRGETVLPAAEADRYRRSASTSNGIDYNKLALAVASAMGSVQINMDSRAVGKLVTPSVSRGIAQQTNQRRYTR